MARFKYTGEAPVGPFEMYGTTWDHGQVSEVSDPDFIRKLNSNQFFEAVDGDTEQPKPKNKGGRPRKEVAHDDADTERAIEGGDGEAGDP